MRKLIFGIIALLFVSSLGLVAFWHWLRSPIVIKYRLTMEVQNGDKTQTASSVIRVDYIPNYHAIRRGYRERGFIHVMGTAPMINLGDKGWLIAALSVRSGRSTLKRRVFGSASNLPFAAYSQGRKSINLHEAYKVRYIAPVVLRPDNYPALIWIPPTGDWRQARQIEAEDSASVIRSD